MIFTSNTGSLEDYGLTIEYLHTKIARFALDHELLDLSV
jgi:hypothetical protein